MSLIPLKPRMSALKNQSKMELLSVFVILCYLCDGSLDSFGTPQYLTEDVWILDYMPQFVSLELF